MNEKPCPDCGYPSPEEPCPHCGGEVTRIYSSTVIQPKRGFFLTDFIEGFVAPFQALLLLMTRKEFMHRLKWPIVVNFLVFSVVMGLGIWGFWSLFNGWVGADWGWFDWLRDWVGGTLAVILTAVALFLLAPTIIETVTGPFLDPLATVTESIITGSEQKPIERGLLRDMVYSVRNAAKILVIQLIILIPGLILSLFGLFFIPILVAAYLNALVWFEIPVMRRSYEMGYRRWVVRRNWARALGFGCAFQLGLFVPFFNIFFLTPAAAVAVSQLYFRFDKVPSEAVMAKLRIEG